MDADWLSMIDSNPARRRPRPFRTEFNPQEKEAAVDPIGHPTVRKRAAPTERGWRPGRCRSHGKATLPAESQEELPGAASRQLAVRGAPKSKAHAACFLSSLDPLETGSAPHSRIPGLPWWLSW